MISSQAFGVFFAAAVLVMLITTFSDGALTRTHKSWGAFVDETAADKAAEITRSGKV
jgi:hypothetical protein